MLLYSIIAWHDTFQFSAPTWCPYLVWFCVIMIMCGLVKIVYRESIERRITFTPSILARISSLFPKYSPCNEWHVNEWMDAVRVINIRHDTIRGKKEQEHSPVAEQRPPGGGWASCYRLARISKALQWVCLALRSLTLGCCPSTSRGLLGSCHEQRWSPSCRILSQGQCRSASTAELCLK